MSLRNLSRPCVLAAIALAPATATAQTPPPATTAAAEASEDTGLGEIVVTAQRRSENQQSVPIAVTAVSGDDAVLLGVSNPQNLTQVVPGFQFQRNSSGAVPFLRGVGTSGSITGNEPSVAIFMDDVYIPSGKGAIFEFNNISSIEALKGPQGTLFGRNATGGVIHIHTKDPSLTEPTIDLNVGYANYDTKSGQLYASVPISDTLAINISAFGTDQSNGWGHNVLTGADVFTDKAWGVRGKVLYKPTTDFSALLSYVHAYRKSDQGMALRVVPGSYGYNNYSPEALGAGFYDAAANFKSIYVNKFDQVSLKLERDFTNATLRSISAYGEIDTTLDVDNDASPTNQIFATVPNWGHTFTQEFQLMSPEHSKLSWIIGAFYMHDTSFYKGISIGTAVAQSSTVPGGNGPGYYNFVQSTQVTNSVSAYAQTTAEILPETNLTIGFRYTLDSRKEQNAHSEIATAAGVPLVQNGVPSASPVFGSTTTFKDVTGRIALDHKFTPDLMAYIAYNRGFKSGVYNLSGYSFSTIAPLPAAQPEKLDAFSVGFKSEWFGHRVRLNAEAFYYDYSNIQVGGTAPPPNIGAILINGGKATIKGIDVDLTVAPTSNLELSASISVLDGKYDTFANGPTYFPLPPNAPIAIPAGCPAGTTYPADSINGAAQRLCNLAGNKTVFTPPFTSTVSAIYKVPTSFGGFDISANWQHGGNYFSDPDNLYLAKQPTYDLVNSSLRWTAPNGNYNIRVFVNNIFGEKYYSYLATATAAGVKYGPSAPRQYGISAGVHF